MDKKCNLCKWFYSCGYVKTIKKEYNKQQAKNTFDAIHNCKDFVFEPLRIQIYG